MITVTLRFFSVLREAFGAGVVEVELEAGTTGGQLIDLLGENNEAFNAVKSAVRIAINDEYVDLVSPLSDGDEVAFITPVSGG